MASKSSKKRKKKEFVEPQPPILTKIAERLCKRFVSENTQF